MKTMNFRSTRAVAASAVLLGACLTCVAPAQAGWGWPSMFSKDKESTNKNTKVTSTSDDWWAARPNNFDVLGGHRKRKEPEPEKSSFLKMPSLPKAPAPVRKVTNGTKRIFTSSVGWIIPKSKPEPKPLTGSNTPWTQSKSRAKPEASKGFSSWFSSSEPEEPARTTRDFLLLDRNDP